MWVAAAIAVVGAIVSFMGQRAQAKAQQIINRANIDAEKTVRTAQNELAGANSTLANFIREENNRRAMEAAGEQFNAIGKNINRYKDDITRGNLQQKTEAAQAFGSINATAAFYGVGGSTINQINDTLRRSVAIGQEYDKGKQGLQIKDMQDQRAVQISNAVAQQDMGQHIAQIQNTIIPEPYVAKPGWMNLVADFANIYTQFGGTFGKQGSGQTPQNSQRFGGGAIATI